MGSYLDDFAAVPMAVTRSGGTWQPAANVASPANALAGEYRDATLLSVACLSGHACTALGWYVDKAGDQEAMAATRPALQPRPPGQADRSRLMPPDPRHAASTPPDPVR